VRKVEQLNEVCGQGTDLQHLLEIRLREFERHAKAARGVPDAPGCFERWSRQMYSCIAALHEVRQALAENSAKRRELLCAGERAEPLAV
jgi:hypothetical protein